MAHPDKDDPTTAGHRGEIVATDPEDRNPAPDPEDRNPKPDPEHRKQAPDPEASKQAASENLQTRIDALTDKWKRALAEAENARKRADAARAEGREHGIAVAVEALAPVFDALALAEAASHTSASAGDPRLAAHLEGLRNIQMAANTGLKALGVRTILPRDTAFDPAVHEAMSLEETDATRPGQVLVVHRPGYAIGHRLIRPAHVTVSASPEDKPET